jgi:hypothetical protein
MEEIPPRVARENHNNPKTNDIQNYTIKRIKEGGGGG